MAGCRKKDSATAPGSIYGSVVDKASQASISGAGVELMPKGLKTVTGYDGTFQFTQIDPGDYNLFVTKTGYKDLKSSTITVKPGETFKGDVQIEKLPSILRIINSEGQDIDSLGFGAENDVTSRTFSIFNDSPRKITWWIEENCSWITEAISMLNHESSGEIEAGRQEPIKVTIDRDALGLGLKSYILNINSDNGSKELLITAGADVGLPSLTTDPVSNLTQYFVTFNGTVINGGTPVYTERGFVYSTNPQPTIDNNLGKIVSGINGQASYSANLNELTPNTTYYVSAYAINAVGVAYGDHVSFTTPAGIINVTTHDVTDIASTSVTCGGTLSLENGNTLPVTARGVCWSTNHNPTTANNHTDDGSGIGSYTSYITNLTINTNYYVRAYATNEVGTFYGEEKTFTTNSGEITVTTNSVTSIGPETAICGGNATVSNENNLPITAKGVCWATTQNPTIFDNHSIDGTGTGAFVSYISGLTSATIYYVRAYASNEFNTYYGEERVFATNGATPIVMLDVYSFEALSSTSVSCTSNILYDGGFTITERGVCWSTVPNPTIADSHTSDGNGTGYYSSVITGLTDNTTYYIRSYATNLSETSYSEQFIMEYDYRIYLGFPRFIYNGNTYVVYSDLGSFMPWHSAVTTCENLTFAGFTDWRLPDLNELYYMYLIHNTIGGFVNDKYWSSDYDNNYHNGYSIDFCDGLTYYNAMNCYVRPIRVITK
jgi:hypothetical protein